MLGQGTETATFKQLFVDWKAPDAADPLKKVQTGGRLAKSISGEFISSIFPTNIHIFCFFKLHVFQIQTMILWGPRTLTVSLVRLVH